ncbi:MAG: hypothetical protein ACTSRP_07155 [Candidatus Helarchaeota archaeon]
MDFINNGFVKNIYLENFKLFEKEELELEPGITILTGRNGVGKSLLIDGIRLAFGLNPIGVRLKYLTEYLKDPKKPARIELILYNPVIGGNRFLICEMKEFQDKYLNSDLVHIRYQINPKGKIGEYGHKGDHQFFMRNQQDKWNPLSNDEVELLLSTLRSVGIDPADKMAFVPAEEFMPFIQSSPQDRFQKFIEKIGLSGSEIHIEQIKHKIKETLESIDEFEKEIKKAEAERAPLEEKHRHWLELQEIKKQIEDFRVELKWIPFFELEKKLKAYPDRENYLRNELTELQQKLDLKKKALQEINNKLEQLKNRSQSEKKKLDDLRKNQISQELEKKQLEEQRNILKKKIKQLREKIVNYSRIKGELEGKYERLVQQIIPIPEVINYKTKLEELKDNITQIEVKIDELEKKKKEFIEKQIKDIDKKIKDIENNIKEIKNKAKAEQDRKLEIIQERKHNLELKKDEIEQNIMNWKKDETNRLIDIEINLKDQIKNIEKEKLKIIEDLKTKSVGGYYPGEEMFFDAIKNKEGIIGPIGSLIKIKNEFKDWIIPVSMGLQGFLGSFIALNDQFYAEADKIRKKIISNHPKQRIRIGKIMKNKKFNLKTDLDKIPEKFANEKAVKEFLLNMIEPYDEFKEYFENYILPFIYESNVILFEDIDINKRTELLNLINKSGGLKKNYSLLTKSGATGRIRKFATDSINLPPPRILIGNKVKRITQKEIDEDKEVKTINQTIKKLKDKLDSIRKLRENLVNFELETKRNEIINQLKELEQEYNKLQKIDSLILEPEEKQKLDYLENLKKELIVKKDSIHLSAKIQEFDKTLKSLQQDLGFKKAEYNDLLNKIKSGDKAAILEKMKDDIKKYNIIIETSKKDLEKNNIELSELERKIKNISKPKDFNLTKDIYNRVKDIETKISSMYQSIGKIQQDIEQLQSHISNKKKEIQNIQKNKDEDKSKFELLKNELKSFSKPKEIRAKSIIEHDLNLKQKELVKKQKLVSDADEKQYQNILKKIKEIKGLIDRRKEEYNKLQDELAKWDQARIKKIEEKIKIINEIFQEILKTIGATGKIVVNPYPIKEIDKTELYFKVEFAENELRDLEEHSTGQKQYSLIALVLAIQSQSRSRITIIDEFTKGLDYSNRNYIIKKVCEMINKLDKMEQEKPEFKIRRQYILTAPDIDIEELPENVNIYTIIRETPELSEIKEGA